MTASDLLRLPDGRAAQYWDSGGRGPAVMFFHGCPDTRLRALDRARVDAVLGRR